MHRPLRGRSALAGTLLVLLTATACSRHAPPTAVAATAPVRSLALDSLARTNAYVFDLRDGVLSGPGAELLRTATAGVQFVALGENHNTRAIPEFTVALFRMLHDEHGFDYLALEEGPALGRLLSERVRDGSSGAALQLGLEYPGSFHMYTEEELRMIDRVAAISRAAADPVWGVNQEFGLSHVLARLAAIAPDDRARQEAQAQLQRAAEHERVRSRDRRYIVDVATADDFRRLREAFRPVAGSEADMLIEQAALSHAIYAPYGVKPNPHFTVFHESGLAREENMKRLFAQQYRAAQARGVERPRVLAKSGHVHLNRGLGAFHETWTLGNFMSEVALLEGSRSLHIYALVHWDDLGESFLAPFMPHVKRGTNTIFDLRPLQPWAAHNAFRGLDPDLRRVLVGSDLLLILDDNRRGSVPAPRR